MWPHGLHWVCTWGEGTGASSLEEKCLSPRGTCDGCRWLKVVKRLPKWEGCCSLLFSVGVAVVTSPSGWWMDFGSLEDWCCGSV